MGCFVLKQQQILLWNQNLSSTRNWGDSLTFPVTPLHFVHYIFVGLCLAHQSIKCKVPPFQGISIICSKDSSCDIEDLLPINNSTRCSSTDRNILNFFYQIFTQEIQSFSLVGNSAIVLTFSLPGVHSCLIESIFHILHGKRFDGRCNPINNCICRYFFIFSGIASWYLSGWLQDFCILSSTSVSSALVISFVVVGTHKDLKLFPFLKMKEKFLYSWTSNPCMIMQSKYKN